MAPTSVKTCACKALKPIVSRISPLHHQHRNILYDAFMQSGWCQLLFCTALLEITSFGLPDWFCWDQSFNHRSIMQPYVRGFTRIATGPTSRSILTIYLIEPNWKKKKKRTAQQVIITNTSTTTIITIIIITIISIIVNWSYCWWSPDSCISLNKYCDVYILICCRPVFQHNPS